MAQLERVIMLKLCVVVVVLSAFGVSLQGQGRDNRGFDRSMIQDCLRFELKPAEAKTSDELTASLYCLKYVTGFVDGYGYASGSEICLPDDGTMGQYTLVVKRYLQDHPERLHLSAGRLLYDALRGAFPCKRSSQ